MPLQGDAFAICDAFARRDAFAGRDAIAMRGALAIWRPWDAGGHRLPKHRKTPNRWQNPWHLFMKSNLLGGLKGIKI